MSRCFSILPLILCCVFGAGTLHAAPDDAAPAPAAEAGADDLTATYQAAQEHFMQKRYTEALPLFLKVARELDSPNAWLYVARCHRKLGRPVEAHEAMTRSFDRARTKSATEPRFLPTKEAAAKELRELNAEVGHLRVEVVDAPHQLLVEANGRKIVIGTVPTIMAPGTVAIIASAPGQPAQRHQLELAAGAHEVVTLRFSGASPANQTKSSNAAPQPSLGTNKSPKPAPRIVEQKGGAVRVVGIVALGISALGFAASGIAGLIGDQRFMQLQEQCNFTRCTDPSVGDDIDIGRALDITANASLALGVATVVSGTLMVIFGGPTESVTETAPQVTFAATPDRVWLGMTTRF